MVIVPIISAFLYRFGGQEQVEFLRPFNQKLWRWLGIGVFIGITCSIMRQSFIPLLAIPTYIIAIQAFPYGDNSYLTFCGQLGKHFVAGLAFGLASFPILGWWALLQALISGAAFLTIEKTKINNPFAEWLRGGVGTILFIIV